MFHRLYFTMSGGGFIKLFSSSFYKSDTADRTLLEILICRSIILVTLTNLK